MSDEKKQITDREYQLKLFREMRDFLKDIDHSAYLIRWWVWLIFVLSFIQFVVIVFFR